MPSGFTRKLSLIIEGGLHATPNHRLDAKKSGCAWTVAAVMTAADQQRIFVPVANTQPTTS
jgi:hypothetical protein